MRIINLEKLAKKEFRKKNLKTASKKHGKSSRFKTKQDILKEIHEFFIKTKTGKKKKNDDLKKEIKKAINLKKEQSKTKKRTVKSSIAKPYFLKNDYFQLFMNELPKLDYEKLFSYVGSGVRENKWADGYFEQQVERIHANETTIERDEAYSIIKEKAWADTLGIATGYLALKNDGTFAYWNLFNNALNKVMYGSSFGVNL